MKRLVDGVHAWVHRAPFGIEVASGLTQRALTLPPDLLGEIIPLAHGLPDDEPAGEAYRRLREAGLADADLPAVDRTVVEHLRRLGAGYAWQLAGHKDAPRLVEVVRAVNAQRKITFDQFGQTTVLPETAVSRALELRRRLGKKARVLLIGDDDMQSPLLTAMGQRVSVLEIDPELVRFLRRTCADAGADVDARCLDVRVPFPADWAGAFDAVLTDPMTFEPCLVAFLARAANALRPGGLLLCAVHTAGGALWRQVLPRLPFRELDVMGALHAYHDEGFTESWYHSDLHVLRRTRGAAPFSPDQDIPFPELILGAHGGPWHGILWAASSPWRRPRFDVLADRFRSWPALARLEVLEELRDEDDRWSRLTLVTRGGGHAVLAYDTRRGLLCATLFPYTTERANLLRSHLAPVFTGVSEGTYRCEAPPLRVPDLAPSRASR
ncbi:MAG: bis-aminopropyl spermidine synthase family protein [Deltaproteobacteria bacterium]|nr:bis-aminopropyl spermidine synthase family protein [Deltaproteobacteria bacterium]